MSFPAPKSGMVINYSYLWHDEKLRGRDEGVKTHPCAIVIATRDDDGDELVYIVPITHTKPLASEGIEIPANIKSLLGLDDLPSWIITTELNCFTWQGYYIRPINKLKGDYVYGYLPTDLFEKVKASINENSKAQRIKLSKR
jgi:hypothetical protein